MLAEIDLAGLWKYIDRGLCIVAFGIVTWWLVRWLWTFINKQRELWGIQDAIIKNLREGQSDAQNRIDNIKAGAAEQLAQADLKQTDLKNQIEEKDGELATLQKEHMILLLWSKTAEIYSERNTRDTDKEIPEHLYKAIKSIGISTGVSPKRAMEIMGLAAQHKPAPDSEGEAAIYWTSRVAYHAGHVLNVMQESVRFPLQVLDDSRENPELDIDALAARLQERWDAERALPPGKRDAE